MRRLRPAAWLMVVVLAVCWAAGSRARTLEEIRRRLRAEAGVEVEGRKGDIPLVGVTVLPGDTHRRLAVELSGMPEAERILRSVAPSLKPGATIHVPRALLAPALADPRTEVLRLGPDTPTLWRLVTTRLRTRGMGVAVTVRNLQRLNGIVDPRRLRRGERILVPADLVRDPGGQGPPSLKISRVYRVRAVKGLERRARPEDFPAHLRRRLGRAGLWRRQLGRREPDLVVLHTTEHRGAPFGNVARYIRRKRLANYLIGPDGTVYEIVPDRFRSFGCGPSLWEGRYQVDLNAINVEIYADTAPGSGGPGIRQVQYRALRALLARLRARYPVLHEGRVVTHRMVAVNYRTGMRSRKGDPYVFEWGRAGLPDNSRALDQDVLLGRARLCTDPRYADRITEGQEAAARLQETL